MGCFLACFSKLKGCIRRKNRNSGTPRRNINGGQVSTDDPVLGVPEKAVNIVPELSEKSEEKQLNLSKQKRVTFDSNVETHEHIPGYGSTDSVEEENNTDDEREKEEAVVKSSESIIDSDDIEREKEEGVAKSSESKTDSVGDSNISSVGSYPQNNRYQNCQDSDDEAIDSEYEDSVVGDVDDECDNKIDDQSMLCEKVWSEAIPTASMESSNEKSLARVNSEEVDSPMICSEDKAIWLNRNLGYRNGSVEHVLSSVENLNQWKPVKSKGSQPAKPQEKENLAANEEAPCMPFSSEPSMKESSPTFKPSPHHQTKNQNKDACVDSSFSNWLVTSETNTRSVELENERSLARGSTSTMSIEDRPILGAWSLEELKQFSASSSPRKSPRRSPRRNPDEMPIIGSVGSYWKHSDQADDCSSATSSKTSNSISATSYKGIPNSTSKYREDKEVSWHSTPFEIRLERALNSDAAES